jgi:ribosome biogenesis GTPase
MTGKQTQRARVLEASRRHVTLFSPECGTVTGLVSSKALDVVAGDLVAFERRDNGVFVTGVEPAVHNLYRSYRGTVKRMGANIDLLCVITAIGQVLKSAVIDRMLVAAEVQSIPAMLVVNKADLGLEPAAAMLETYRAAGIEILTCSAKHLNNFDTLRERLNDPGIKVAALCGVSGVGKSTILNRLVPDAQARTGAVSDRTGQGKQTTTQPRAFLYGTGGDKAIIDFPGVQFFGLSHETPQAITKAFPEFLAAAHGCRYADCRHLQEPECAVRTAIEAGTIASWRYDSYRQILQEIEDAREY